MRGLAALTLVALVAQPALANPSHNAKDALDQGRTAYDRGDYGRAIDTINPLLYPSIELGTEDEVVAAHKLLALSYFFVNKQKDAENEVTSLLALRPNYQLDPIVDHEREHQLLREQCLVVHDQYEDCRPHRPQSSPFSLHVD